MIDSYLAIVNPAAGGGKCGGLAGPALEQLRAGGLRIELEETCRPGHAAEIARGGYRRGCRSFIAVGGDGTAFEIVNGLFPEAVSGGIPTLAFLPLGTGNSFLRDFGEDGYARTAAALLSGRKRPCDLLRLTHRDGVLFYINLLSMGFTADVAALTNRRFKALGELGYLLSVLICLARLRRRAFPLRVDGNGVLERERCLFLSFSNSKYTGGRMLIAPQADVSDGLIEFVRWGPIGRLGLLLNLHTLFDGSHIRHAMASRRSACRVSFELDGPVDVMIDGEVLNLHCLQIDVLPSALQITV
ncbi:MAG: hypothetical protein HY650_05920 [Acidobacteria bacterium]|nr:hypothetical protein [Acidobacteriota bacterium]